MIQFANNSDITKITSGIVAHGVNCQGVMGGGAALAIRNRWPAVYDAYKRMMKDISPGGRRNLLGNCHIIRVNDGLYVANCYTQEFYGGDGARYADPNAVRTALEFVFSNADAMELTVHAVKIASDLGGLDWNTEVLPIFEDLNSEYNDDLNVIIHSL